MRNNALKTCFYILSILAWVSPLRAQSNPYVIAAQVHISVTHHLLVDVFLNGNKIINADDHVNDPVMDITQNLAANQLCYFLDQNCLGVEVDQTLGTSVGPRAMIGVAYVIKITLSDKSVLWVTSDDEKTLQYHHGGFEPSGWADLDFDDYSWSKATLFSPTSMATTLINPQTDSRAGYFRTFADGDDNLMVQTLGDKFFFREKFNMNISIPPGCGESAQAQPVFGKLQLDLTAMAVPNTPTVTSTSTPTKTPTPLPTWTPSATATPIPPTPTPTSTPVPPTSTPTPFLTWTPSPQPTSTFTPVMVWTAVNPQLEAANQSLGIPNLPATASPPVYFHQPSTAARPSLPYASVFVLPPISNPTPRLVSRSIVTPTSVPEISSPPSEGPADRSQISIPSSTMPVQSWPIISQNNGVSGVATIAQASPTPTFTTVTSRKRKHITQSIHRATPTPESDEGMMGSAIAFSSLPVNIDAVFADGPGLYQCEIVDSRGRHISTIFSKQVAYEKETWISWDATNNQGQRVAYGWYFAILTKNGRRIQKIPLNWIGPNP